MTADTAQPTSLAGLLNDIAFATHCDHHRHAQEALALIAERDKEAAELRAEVSRLRTLLGAACVSNTGGRLILDWDAIDSASPNPLASGSDPLTVFGWRGEWIVVQCHPYEPADGDEIDQEVKVR